jgi:hypothetical protein
MDNLDHLIETLEILRDGVRSSDQEKAQEAITILLLQCTEQWGGTELFSKLLPTLETAKGFIDVCDFDEAEVYVLALLAKFRQVNKRMQGLQ